MYDEHLGMWSSQKVRVVVIRTVARLHSCEMYEQVLIFLEWILLTC